MFILIMCTQRPFTSQVISEIYFLTFASYIEKLPETTINVYTAIYTIQTENMRLISVLRKNNPARADVGARATLYTQRHHHRLYCVQLRMRFLYLLAMYRSPMAKEGCLFYVTLFIPACPSSHRFSIIGVRITYQLLFTGRKMYFSIYLRWSSLVYCSLFCVVS